MTRGGGGSSRLREYRRGDRTPWGAVQSHGYVRAESSWASGPSSRAWACRGGAGDPHASCSIRGQVGNCCDKGFPCRSRPCREFWGVWRHGGGAHSSVARPPCGAPEEQR